MIELNPLIRNLAYGLTRKRVRESSLVVCEINRKREDVAVFSLSTNVILSFTHEGQIWYFRECPRIQPAQDYWEDAIKRFFDSLDRLRINKAHFSQEIPIRIAFSDEEKAWFQTYIESKKSDRAFKIMLKQADVIAQNVHFSIWENQTYDNGFFQSFALFDLPENCRDIAVFFLWNMRAAASNFRLMPIVRGQQYSFFGAAKAVASRIVAEELNLAHLITPAQWCRLMLDDDTVLFGVMSPSAPGGRMVDTAIPLTGSLQRELLCLNVLDAICNQPDHGPDNYNVTVKEDGGISVCAFDNDNPKTFFPQFSVFHSLAGAKQLVGKNHQILRPYMDRELVVNLKNLDESKLCRRLKPYLNWLQVAAVRYRLRSIRRAIAQSEKLRPDFLLDINGWNPQTIAEEMSGTYAETYLTKINKRDELL